MKTKTENTASTYNCKQFVITKTNTTIMITNNNEKKSILELERYKSNDGYEYKNLYILNRIISSQEYLNSILETMCRYALKHNVVIVLIIRNIKRFAFTDYETFYNTFFDLGFKYKTENTYPTLIFNNK